MIKSFKNKDTENIFKGIPVRKFDSRILKRARIKLKLLDSAQTRENLKVTPGNRLKALSGNRAGQDSVRINDQWRICFLWKDGDAWEVEITDYH